MTDTADRDKLGEIRRLYFAATPATILDAFDRAIDLIKSMSGEAERERATVYMQGLAEMRKEFGVKKRAVSRPAKPRRDGRPR
jgi:hypothetical protein